MSSFSGRVEEPWSLSRAVDALASAARAAGRPGLIWIAGMGYPTVGLGLGAGWTGGWLGDRTGVLTPLRMNFGGLTGLENLMTLTVAGGLVGLPLLLVILRLRVGLARIAPPGIWNLLAETFGKARLRQAWRAGKGLTAPTFGMSIMLTLMMLAAVLVVALPVTGLVQAASSTMGEPGTVISALMLIAPGVAIMAAYAIALSVLQQLALQSLAHNRRGVASALTHAWRIARHDPWATGRTIAVDLILNITVFVPSLALATLLRVAPGGGLAIWVVFLPLLGFMGVTRAGYWARAYRALGGLSPDDGIPGLVGEALGSR